MMPLHVHLNGVAGDVRVELERLTREAYELEELDVVLPDAAVYAYAHKHGRPRRRRPSGGAR